MHYSVAGIDEVGRGALAGPVIVGAVVFSCPEYEIKEGLALVLGRAVADSKQLTALQRERAAEWLGTRVKWATGSASPQEINKRGIVWATTKAAGRALSQLQFDQVHADASLFHPYEKHFPTKQFVKGDEKILSIMCASILAKVERDKFMTGLACQHIHYGWEQNKGYGSLYHRSALQQYGSSKHHRTLFIRSTLDAVATP